MSAKGQAFGKQPSSGRRSQLRVEELEPRTLLHAGLSATGIPAQSLLAGFHYAGPVATFRDPALKTWMGNVTVSINWGDRTPADQSTDIRAMGGGTFQVWDGHTYQSGRAAPYVLTVRVTERNGSAALATSLFRIVTPSVSLHLSARSVTHGGPLQFQIQAANTPGNQPPTGYLLEYQAPHEHRWHQAAQGSWRGTPDAHGNFDLTGTVRPSKPGTYFVRALATINGVPYPSPAVEVTVR